MTLHKIASAGMVLILLGTGCVKKDDLTLPVKVNLKFGIKQDNPEGNHYINITGCRIAVGRIGFEGTREAGGNVFFETEPSLYMQPLVLSEDLVTLSSFDLPQGVYEGMKWDISMNCLTETGIDDGRNSGYPCLGILLHGSYTYLDGSVVPFVLAIDRPELFRIMASSPEGYSTIVLSVGKVYDAIVYFSAYDTFRSISRNMLEEAEITGTPEQPVMIISTVKNMDLYTILLYRFILTTNMIVK